jgi:hypothetical protein
MSIASKELDGCMGLKFERPGERRTFVSQVSRVHLATLFNDVPSELSCLNRIQRARFGLVSAALHHD